MGWSNRTLSADRIRALVEEVLAAESLPVGEKAQAVTRRSAPLRRRTKKQVEAARAMARLLRESLFEREMAWALAAECWDAFSLDPEVVSHLGEAFSSLIDIRYLNEAPPQDPLLSAIAERLTAWTADIQTVPEKERSRVHEAQAAAGMRLGRRWDGQTEASHLQLLDLEPEVWFHWYNFGLFLKNRGRFSESVKANLRAREIASDTKESIEWNLGISATGAGEGEIAIEVWRRMGQKLEMGPRGRPEGSYPAVKVRLAQHPVAVRTAEQDAQGPGLEETIWVERLSPCHGRVLSALFHDEIGVEYGDEVMFDGAPITYHPVGDRSVPVFPHLSTLHRAAYRVHRFGGRQQEARQIERLSEVLPGDSTLYPHTELFARICLACYEGRGSHTHDEDEHHVVTGKLCIPPDIETGEVLSALDAGVAGVAGVEVYVPDLVKSAGDEARAEMEARRLGMIEDSLRGD